MEPTCCIYCGRKDNLSKSDIIPDCLTNAKLKVRFVCAIEHNSKFTSSFESEAVGAFSYLANLYSIKDSKSNDYSPYRVCYLINGKEFFLTSRKIFPSISDAILSDKKDTLIGPIDKITLIAQKKQKGKEQIKQSLRELDPEHDDMKQIFRINFSDISSLACRRLAARIAFEWFSFENGLFFPDSITTRIRSFICKGSEDQQNVYVLSRPENYLADIVSPTLGTIFWYRQ